jgi:hypothetical protein
MGVEEEVMQPQLDSEEAPISDEDAESEDDIFHMDEGTLTEEGGDILNKGELGIDELIDSVVTDEPRKCPSCDAEIPPDFHFCGKCGEKLD